MIILDQLPMHLSLGQTVVKHNNGSGIITGQPEERGEVSELQPIG